MGPPWKPEGLFLSLSLRSTKSLYFTEIRAISTVMGENGRQLGRLSWLCLLQALLNWMGGVQEDLRATPAPQPGHGLSPNLDWLEFRGGLGESALDCRFLHLEGSDWVVVFGLNPRCLRASGWGPRVSQVTWGCCGPCPPPPRGHSHRHSCVHWT